MLDDDIIKPTLLKELQDELLKSFMRFDESVARCYEGAIRTLADKGNPDRFRQVAHSARSITQLLSRKFDVEISEDEGCPKKLVEIFNHIIEEFEKALKLIPIPDGQRKKLYQNDLRNRFKSLLSGMSTSRGSMMLKLRSFFIDADKVGALNAQLRQTLKLTLKYWSQHYEYFTGVGKGNGEVNEDEFMLKWDQIHQ